MFWNILVVVLIGKLTLALVRHRHSVDGMRKGESGYVVEIPRQPIVCMRGIYYIWRRHKVSSLPQSKSGYNFLIRRNSDGNFEVYAEMFPEDGWQLYRLEAKKTLKGEWEKKREYRLSRLVPKATVILMVVAAVVVYLRYF